MKNPFREFDKKVKVIPEHQAIRDEMIKLSGWQKTDGDFPGHFQKRTGHRCIWTCKWSTGLYGLLLPDDWYRLDAMKSFELVAEAEDILKRYPDDYVKLSPLLNEYYRGDASERWIYKLLKGVKRMRGKYDEYVFQPNPPPPLLLMYPKYRPGLWGPEIKTPVTKPSVAAYARGGTR